MQWAEEAVRRKRAVVPLPEGQSIGLELDFCTEVRKGRLSIPLVISMYFIRSISALESQ